MRDWHSTPDLLEGSNETSLILLTSLIDKLIDFLDVSSALISVTEVWWSDQASRFGEAHAPESPICGSISTGA